VFAEIRAFLGSENKQVGVMEKDSEDRDVKD
jgi:hypothetical protein